LATSPTPWCNRRPSICSITCRASFSRTAASIIVWTMFIRVSNQITCTAALYPRTELGLIHIITNTPCLTAPSLNPWWSWVWNIYNRIRYLSERSNQTEPIDLILPVAGNCLLSEVMGNIYINRMSNIRTSSHYKRTR
jgi:hypothetical protein